jgi:hypothetical protein
MAKKKKPPVKKPAKPTVAAKPLSTEFIRAFIATFIEPKTWPGPTQSNASIVADFATFTNVLMTAYLLLQPPVPDGSGSVSDRLAKFVIAQGWPVTTPIVKRLRPDTTTVRLYEISAIAYELLGAINDWRNQGGRGGGGGQWPPH